MISLETLENTLNLLKQADVAAIDDGDMVKIAHMIKGIGSFCAVIDAELHQRVVVAGRMVPGAATKPEVKHRKWHDQETAEQLAREELGDDAFEVTLKSPAGIEKLGDKGKQFVSVASFKPEAGKKVVY